MRIFLGYSEVAGYFSGLKAGLEEHGLDVCFANLGRNPYGYSGGASDWLVRTILSLRQINKTKGIVSSVIAYAFEAILRLVLLLNIVIRYDAVIIAGSTSLLGQRELPVLRLFGIKTIAVFLGSDSRPAYINGAIIEEFSGDTKAVYQFVQKQLAYIRKIEKYATYIIVHDACAHFFKRDVIKYLDVGFPRMELLQSALSLNADTGQAKPIKILHAPSRPIQKGSHIFQAIIKKLQDEGSNIDYVELRGVPNEKVMAELQTCDFVLDEVYSDLPLAGFACEAAAYAKPAIVGGYAADLYKRDIEDDTLPSVFSRPEHIEANIRRLLQDTGYREQKGKDAYLFVTEAWSAKAVAARYLEILEGRTPQSWIFNANKVDYLLGWGIEKSRLQDFLKEYLAVQGRSGLCLADKPELEAAFIKFAEGA